MLIVEQLATFLEDQGLGVMGQSIFVTSEASKDVTNCLIIRQANGDKRETQQLPGKDYFFQVTVRNSSGRTGLEVANSIASLFEMDTSTAVDLRNGYLVDGENQICFTDASGPETLNDDESKRSVHVVNLRIRALN